jgi:hypothetical protein
VLDDYAYSSNKENCRARVDVNATLVKKDLQYCLLNSQAWY